MLSNGKFINAEIIPRAAELIALSSDAFKINYVFSYEVDIPKK